MAKNIIILTRGDTFDFDVTIYEELYRDFFDGALPGDLIEFRLLKPNTDSSEALLVKQVTIGENNPYGKCTFVLSHSDTKNLPAGVYYYTIKLIRYDSQDQTGEPQVNTIINKTKFILND